MPHIGENYLLHPTAQAIWEAARNTYSTVDNSSALFEIETQLFHLKQEDRDVIEYFNILGRFWLHLDMYENQQWDTPADQSRFKKYIEKKRTLYFLLGLSQNLDDVKGRIMSTKPFPSLNEAFAEIKREESRRQLMIPDPKSQGESSALAVRSHSMNRHQQSRDEDYVPVCEHCHKQWHVKADCWELNGKPAGWKPRSERRKQAHVSTTETQMELKHEPTPFSKEQAGALEKLFSKMMSKAPQPNPPDIYSGVFANRGNQISAYSVNSTQCDQWIIDSGCSDHMTGSKELLDDYQCYPKKAGVRIADGSLSPVEGIGRVRITNEIELFRVLFVPALHCNLISISQLTRDLNCKAVFSSDRCSLQEECSGRTIGTGRLQEDLFIIKGCTGDGGPSERKSRALATSSTNSIDSQVMLWHSRLGHPSFGYLERLLPKLFSG
ncbi:Retrovirus-related Pol polyprotein from transposon RE2 [Linum perenne]